MEEIEKKLTQILERLDFIEKQNQKLLEVQTKQKQPCGQNNPQGSARFNAQMEGIMRTLKSMIPEEAIKQNPIMAQFMNQAEEIIKKTGQGGVP